MRRAFDLICVVIGVMALSPFLVIIGLAIKLEDGGPVFYSQLRVGRNFRKFRLYKFRSMVPHADRLGALTKPGDSRITRVGRFLRQYKFDELPQLINILKGDMQLVGARPEVERYVEIFRSQYASILRDRPGITDPASLAFRHEEEIFGTVDVERQYISHILPRKLELSIEYSRRRNFFTDLMLIFKTVLGVKCRSESSQVIESIPDNL